MQKWRMTPSADPPTESCHPAAIDLGSSSVGS